MIGEQQRGLLFVMIGAGGTGKNTLMNQVMGKQALTQLATATTREIRDNEQEGREHIFVSVERFHEMIENGDLLEYQEVTPGKFYGIPRQSVEVPLRQGRSMMADIDVYGAKVLRETYPDDTVLIFVTAPGDTVDEQLATLRERMLNRLGEEPTPEDIDQITKRLERARTIEMPFAEECDHILVNDDLEETSKQLENIIQDKLKERQS